MKKIVLGLVASLVLASASPAGAVSLLSSNCVSVTDIHGCLFAGTISTSPHTSSGSNGYLDAEAAYNGAFTSGITLDFITSATDSNFASFGSITGAGTDHGTWTLSNYAVDYVAIEASRLTVLYAVPDLSTDVAWNTLDIQRFFTGLTSPRDETNILFFGTAIVDTNGNGAVPEPSSWIMLLAGFLGLGATVRALKRWSVASIA